MTAAVAKLSNDEAADYSESEVAAADEFAPKYQKALCKTCGDALDGFAQNRFKKAVSTTAADYVSPVGTWTYKNVTVASGDYDLYSMLVTESSGKYSVEIYLVEYDAENKTTEATSLNKVTAELNTDPDTKVRSLTFTDGNSSKYILSSNGTTYTLSIAGAPQKMTSDTVNTVNFGKDKEHTAHVWEVMDWKGVKTFSPDTAYNTAAASINDAFHYISCDCGVALVKESCSSNARGETQLDPAANTACKYCGFTLKKDAYKQAEIISSTDNSNGTHTDSIIVLVSKDSAIELSGTSLVMPNGSTFELSGWNVSNALWNEGKLSLTADKAKLIYTVKN